MASASRTTRSKLVQVEEQVFTLTLSEREAADLLLYLQYIDGSPTRSARRSVGPIRDALRAAGVRPTVASIIQPMEFPGDYQIDQGVFSALED